jgi:site-specific recombinase XerD
MTYISLIALSQDIEEFLKFKRALGFPYGRGEHALRSFERYAKRRATAEQRRSVHFESTLKAWLARIPDRKPVTVANDLGAVRQLCLHRRRRDPRGFVPEYAWAPHTESVYLPYIFSREEIRQLLRAAGRHRGRSISAGILRLLLLILYCTGLRFGEAVRLQLTDVDLSRHSFFIRESKGRSRVVPFGADLAREVRSYLAERAAVVRRSDAPHSNALFVRLSGKQLTLMTASGAVKQLLRREGLKPARGRLGPRPFDFRHAFAVHRLTDWYRKKVDIHARLPWLSAYMGHVNVLGTESYLHATPELLRLASHRLEQRLLSARRKS